MASRMRVMVGTAGVLLVGGLFVLARVAPLNQWLDAWDLWAGDNLLLALLSFVGVYVVATVLLAPGSPLALAAGALFGIGAGVAAVSIGSTIGAALAFLISRYVAREQVTRWLAGRPRTRAIDAAIQRGGWRVVVLLRLSPVVPFNLQNYLYGLTTIGFWPFFISSWLAMLPGTLLYVYLGHIAADVAAGRLQDHGHGIDPMLIATVVGLVATAVVTIYIAVLARRELATLDPAAD